MGRSLVKLVRTVNDDARSFPQALNGGTEEHMREKGPVFLNTLILKELTDIQAPVTGKLAFRDQPLNTHKRTQNFGNYHAAVPLLAVFQDGEPGAANGQT